MNLPIKSSNSNSVLNHVLCMEEHNQVYFIGKNYFRQWTLDFGEKSMKESNIRTIERALKSYNIIDWIEVKNDKKVVKNFTEEDPFKTSNTNFNKSKND